jgi:Arc/MetJ-type ribon-helix-helix transcriptional regulator
MTIENERFLEQAVAEGRFQSRDEALNEAVCLLRGELQDNGNNGSVMNENLGEWSNRFRNWLNSHKDLESIADDSRESIYFGRGE